MSILIGLIEKGVVKQESVCFYHEDMSRRSRGINIRKYLSDIYIYIPNRLEITYMVSLGLIDELSQICDYLEIITNKFELLKQRLLMIRFDLTIEHEVKRCKNIDLLVNLKINNNYIFHLTPYYFGNDLFQFMKLNDLLYVCYSELSMDLCIYLGAKFILSINWDVINPTREYVNYVRNTKDHVYLSYCSPSVPILFDNDDKSILDIQSLKPIKNGVVSYKVGRYTNSESIASALAFQNAISSKLYVHAIGIYCTSNVIKNVASDNDAQNMYCAVANVIERTMNGVVGIDQINRDANFIKMLISKKIVGYVHEIYHLYCNDNELFNSLISLYYPNEDIDDDMKLLLSLIVDIRQSRLSYDLMR